MNHWKKCLQCWIPASKKNDKTSVINAGAETEAEGDLDLDRSSSVSLDPVPQPLPVPYRRSSAAAAPYLEDSHFWPPPQGYTGNSSDSSENYIPLDECLSGTRGPRQLRSLPKLVSRDIHLLDRVPPSPCSLTENPVSLSGMPEVYAPMLSRNLMGPPSLSPRLASRGCDGTPRRNHQLVGHCVKRDPHGSELAAFETSASPNHKADLRNNNTCFDFKPDHGRLVNSRSDPRTRAAYSSVSSEASLTDQRPCCPSRLADSHSVTPDRSECLHYRNIQNTVERQCLVNQHSLPLTINGGGVTTSKMIAENSGELLRSRSGQGPEALGYSLDSKILHMTPPAPPPNTNKAKAHKYVNANGNCGANREGPDSCRSTPSYSEDARLPPTSDQSGTNESDGYYNLIPTNGQSLKTESGEQLTPPPPLPPPCHGPSSSRKKQFQQRPQLPHESPHRRSPLAVAVALPQRARRQRSKTTDDSSSSNDEDGSSGGFSATNSNTSLNRQGDLSLLKCFTTKPPAPSQQPPIEYLQLDLDQPSYVAKGSPGPIHRSQNNSTIDYIEIDPCRTKALSDTRKQLESNRHKTSH